MYTIRYTINKKNRYEKELQSKISILLIILFRFAETKFTFNTN